MRYSSGTVKLWFDYLKLAARSGAPVNWKYYRDWGTKDELLGMSFNAWWKQRGKALFAANPQAQRDTVELEREGDRYVVVKIATDAPMGSISRRVSEIVRSARAVRRTRSFGKFAPTGQVNYKTLAAYKRLLAISVNPKNASLSMVGKIELLKDQYAGIHARMKKQREKLRAKGERGRRLARRLRSHEPDTFDTGDDPDHLDLKSFSEKKAYRWLVSAQLVMLNVAEGKFPGDGYYGAKISERLRSRMRAMGLGS